MPIADDATLLSSAVTARFEMGGVLHRSASSVVYAARCKETNVEVTVSIRDRASLSAEEERRLLHEIKIMPSIVHPNIQRLHFALLEADVVVVALSSVKGDLLQHIMSLKHYSEREIQHIVRDILSGVRYLHEDGVVHLNLYPGNVQVMAESSEESYPEFCISGFGCAAIHRGFPLKRCIGTPHFMAPEMLRVALDAASGQVDESELFYDASCDVWSCGVICYWLLTGMYPFDGCSIPALFKAIKRGRADYAQAVWNPISVEAREFVMSLLNPNPVKRLTAAMALEHRWMGCCTAALNTTHLADTHRRLCEFVLPKSDGTVFAVEAELRRKYFSQCRSLRLKPNSKIDELLTVSSTSLEVLDLTNNYLGPRGLTALVELITDHSSVTKLVLCDCRIDDDQGLTLLGHISRRRSNSSRIKYLNLDGNLISHAVGRRLLAMLQQATTIAEATVDRTMISLPLQKKIAFQSARNRSRHVLSCTGFPVENSP